MSLSEEDKFDEEEERQEWRNAFEHTADTPPDRVWEAIARQLDEQESRPIVPLWKQPAGPGFRPWAYGAVAAVALLLIGWWSLRSVETPKTESVADQVVSSPDGVINPPAAQSHTPSKNIPGTNLAATTKPQTTNEKLDRSSVPHSRVFPSRYQAGHVVALNSGRSAVKHGVTQRLSGVDDYRALSNALAITRQSALASRTLYSEAVVESAMGSQRLTYEASLLPNRAITPRRYQPISRIVWYWTPDAIEPQKSKRLKNNELWAGLSATPMSFNPVAAIAQPTSVQSMAYNSLTASNVNSSKTAVQNEAQLSMAWQANAGVQVSRHWSVETGVQYLNGKSQARNNTSVFRLATSQAENALVNAVRNSSAASSPINASADVYTAAGGNAVVNSSYTTVIPTSDQVTNNFQYLQIPVQAGYRILPDRKLSYAVLGGLLANVFLQNTIDGSLDVKPSDQVYRPLLLAGTAGLRVSYQATAHWFGSLTGSYQQALQSGTHSNAQLTTHPQAVGIGFGLNYRFQ